jgi:hypothetical protein
MLITYDHDSSAERPDSRREEERSSPRDFKVHTVEALFSPTTSSHRLCPSPPWSTPWFCPSSIRFAAAATATSLTFLVRRLLFREDGIERKSTGFDMMVGTTGFETDSAGPARDDTGLCIPMHRLVRDSSYGCYFDRFY